MVTRLFEDRDHATFYQKYRFSPPENIQGTILAYLKSKGTKFHLAVDVGCGSGQSTQMLAKWFEKVIGTDISEAQIEEAKRAAHASNISYAACPAEEMPLDDNSVDLLTGFAAVHWFDTPRFMKEVERVLKPSGCVAFSCNHPSMQVHYKDCSKKLTEIFAEVQDLLLAYADEKVKLVMNEYKEIFDALPFHDKERSTDVVDKVTMTVAGIIGLIQSFSMYQTLLKAQPEAAKSLLQNTERRMLDVMGVSSCETQVELWMRHICILGCKSP